jgi:2-oxoglutarate dehydrogenase complex dehydrogenase (E1) component-like enzyme
MGDMQDALDAAEDKHTVAMTDATTRRMKVEADIAAQLAETRQTGGDIAELRQMVAALIQMSGIPQMSEASEAPEAQPEAPEQPMPGAMEPMQEMPPEMMQAPPEGMQP